MTSLLQKLLDLSSLGTRLSFWCGSQNRVNKCSGTQIENGPVKEYWFWQLRYCWSLKFQKFIHKDIRISHRCLGICPGYSCCCCLPVSHSGERKKRWKKKKKETFEVDVIDKQNIIHEKAKFARRCQEQGQTAEAFITADHSFAEHCIYRMLKEELIRGRIIFGKRDNQFISTTYA